MKLGLLADIHEDVVHLRTAIERFWQRKSISTWSWATCSILGSGLKKRAGCWLKRVPLASGQSRSQLLYRTV